MNFRPDSSVAARLCIVLVSVLVLAPLGYASDVTFTDATLGPPGTRHQLWMVSTRQASSCPTLQQTSRLRYWRCDPDRAWRSSSVEELLASDDPSVRTLIYVHENRVSEAGSFARACQVFEKLSRVAPAHERFRMIAVSWPSDRIGHRQRPDVQIKAQRSEAHGFYLAWLIDRIHPEVPITLFGDSFGPRLISASLHCLGGGSIAGQCLPHRTYPQRRPVRAVLMSAALDANWLLPGQRFGLAMSQVEHMLVTVNPSDEALHWYPRISSILRRGSGALGCVGLPSPDSLGSKVVQWNVSAIVGRTHSWEAYEGSPRVLPQLVPHLFGP